MTSILIEIFCLVVQLKFDRIDIVGMTMVYEKQLLIIYLFMWIIDK